MLTLFLRFQNVWRENLGIRIRRLVEKIRRPVDETFRRLENRPR